MKKIAIFGCIALLCACNSKTNQTGNETIQVPTEKESKEFEEAAEKTAKLLQPESANLSFSIDGNTYSINNETLEVAFFPFTVYKPVDEEEGEMEEESLIWLQGSDVNNKKIKIKFELTLKGKFANGTFTVSEGNIYIDKDDQSRIYSAKKINITISDLVEKKFTDEITGYSLDMNFSGTYSDLGPKGKTYEVSDGSYQLKY